MAASLKISADTSDAKKSILELSKTVKDVKSSEISIFTNDDKRFIKRELNKELTLMKNKLKDNQKEITKLVDEQRNLTKGSEDERRNREQIVKAYRTQARLAKEIQQVQRAKQQAGGGLGGLFGGGAGGGGMMGGLGKLLGGLAMGGIAAGALGIPLAIGSTKQYMSGAPTRTRATGLGIRERTQLSPEQIAEAGLTEQQLLERRTRSAALGGRAAGDEQSVLQQARFERAYGLEQGTMTNTIGGLRSAFGTRSNEAQQELQASIMASGMEDAIGPYLETMTTLLSNINENGMTQTDALTQAIGELAAQGDRTPEQIARTFQNVQRSVQGSKGEANAFLQAAMARGGIGGGTIGGTRFAMETGGILGMDPTEFAQMGFGGAGLQKKLGEMGMFSGLGQRSTAIINQFKKSAGLGSNQSFGDIQDPSQLFALNNLANNVFGTEGTGGMEALSQLERVQQGKMGREKFEEKLKEIREGKNPQVERLDKINSTLAGQTEVLTAIKENLMEAIGQETIGTGIGLQRADAARVRGQGEVVKTGSKATEGAVRGAASAAEYIFEGGLGEDIYDFFTKESTPAQKRAAQGGFMGFSASSLVESSKGGAATQAADSNKQAELIGRSVEKGVQKGMSSKQPGTPGKPNIKNNIKIINGDGRVTNKTTKSR